MNQYQSSSVSRNIGRQLNSTGSRSPGYTGFSPVWKQEETSRDKSKKKWYERKKNRAKRSGKYPQPLNLERENLWTDKKVRGGRITKSRSQRIVSLALLWHVTRHQLCSGPATSGAAAGHELRCKVHEISWPQVCPCVSHLFIFWVARGPTPSVIRRSTYVWRWFWLQRSKTQVRCVPDSVPVLQIL